MMIKADPDLEKLATFMQEHLQADRLVPTALALAKIAPALWGQHHASEVQALSLVADQTST